MGRKVHPIGFRLGTVRDWRAKWHADKHFVEYLQEDLKLREAINKKYNDAGVSAVEIERQSNKVVININTARPGIVIGRGGQRVEEMRAYLDKLVGRKTQINIKEISQPELDALLVAKQIAEQIERRIAYRRAMKQSMFRSIQAGAKGIKISCSGRLGGAEIARRQVMHQGRVPLHTLRADIDYGYTQAHTGLGRIGVKVWIYRGDILPKFKESKVIEEVVAVSEVVAENSDKVEMVTDVLEKVIEKVTEDKEAKPKKKVAAKKKVTAKADKEDKIEAKAKAEVKAVEDKEAKPKKKVAAKKKVTAKTVEKEEKTEKPKKQAAKKEAEKTIEAEAKIEADTKKKPAAKKKTAAKAKKPKEDKEIDKQEQETDAAA